MVKIVDISAVTAFEQYAAAQGLRGKDLIEVLRKVTRYVVSFSIAKIPKGDPKRIREELTTIVTTYSKTDTRNIRSATKRASQWRGTLAARLVAMLDWKGARAAAAFGDYEGFYAAAAQFTARRAFAANLHRSGLREAVTRLRTGTGGTRLPQFKNQPGDYTEAITDAVTRVVVENWASSKNGDGIVKLAGNVFEQAFVEAEQMIANFLQKDAEAAARKAGLTAKS